MLRKLLLSSLLLALAASGMAQASGQAKAKQDLVVWKEVMEMFIMDDGHYPEAVSIESLAQEAYTRLYWDQPIVTDPSGRPYQATSSKNHYRIATADGMAYVENGFKLPVVKEEPKPPTSSPSFSFPTPRSPDTSLYVTKSGNDIRLDWSGIGPQYDGSMGTGPHFYSERTLFTGSTASAYLYKNGLLKYDETFLCFDVTDQTEQNHGGYWNGGVLPPPPPYIDAGSPSTNIGSLFIGSTGTIVGTGFSTNAAENFICFDGGVCTPSTTATATQVQFTTPPGAVSGDLTVQVGAQSSDPAAAFVTLEDPAPGWLIHTIGFSSQTGEFWMSGTASGVASLYRVYYDSGTKKWAKEDRKGGMSAQLLYCSTQTTRNGYYYCGYGTNDTGGGGTRWLITSNLASYLQGGVNLGGSGVTSNIRGAAADPNPAGVGGRDVSYFAHAISGTGEFYIKKVDEACSTVLDSNYGNFNWSPNWGGIVGMAVDPVNGDLYVGTLTNISKIDTSENITAVKGGFTSIAGLDIFRQSSGDPGFLLVADAGSAGAGYLKAIALDNTATAPITVASVANMRAVNWGGVVFSQAAVNSGTAIRRVAVHNNGNTGAVNPIRANPFIGVSPGHSSDLWISAPLPEGGSASGPAAQAYVHPSDANDATYSRGRIYMWYKDDKSRLTCAFTGDPGKAATGYEPDPANLNYCDKPRTKVAAICDNKDDIVNGGVGSFVETSVTSSCKTCGSSSNKCLWEFNITQRYGGDNYKVYFQTADYASQTYFASASPVYNAVKHFHVESDKMCQNGGILKFNAAIGDGFIYLAMNPDGSRADTVNTNNVIDIFDSATPYELAHDVLCARVVTPDVPNLRVRVDLGEQGNCAQPATLGHAYFADVDGLGTDPWDFSSGNSAGVCVDDNLFYQADVSDLRQSYDEAFVNYHVPPYGAEGAGVVPYLPLAWFDIPDATSAKNFSRIWFSHYIADTIGTPPQNKPHNYLHLIGANESSSQYGFSVAGYDCSFVMIQGLINNCQPQPGVCIRSVTAHEFAHHMYTNMCTNLVNCGLPPPPTFGPHDYRGWWQFGGVGCPSANPCLMDPQGGNLADGIDRFCIEDLLLGDPNCAAPIPPAPRNGAIRTGADPR